MWVKHQLQTLQVRVWPKCLTESANYNSFLWPHFESSSIIRKVQCPQFPELQGNYFPSPGCAHISIFLRNKIVESIILLSPHENTVLCTWYCYNLSALCHHYSLLCGLYNSSDCICNLSSRNKIFITLLINVVVTYNTWEINGIDSESSLIMATLGLLESCHLEWW